MTPRRVTTFRVDEELLTGLRIVQERDGVPVSEQVRRAIRAWLDEKDVHVKSERKQPSKGRKRS